MPTVFVLGAGASRSYGFPTAFGLLQIVCRLLNQESGRTALQDLGFFRVEDFSDLSSSLMRSGCCSVDEFLELRPQHLALGRAAIVLAIGKQEDDSCMFAQRGGDLVGGPEDHPYGRILDALWDPKSRSVAKGKAAFVTFNYDRSLEHYLCVAVSQRRGCSYEEALADVGALPLVHVYGSLGPLSPRDRPSPGTRPYEPTMGNPTWNRLSCESLRLVGEERDGGKLVPQDCSRARALVAESSRVVFLGFGYSAVNLARIKPELRASEAQMFGTAMGLERAERGRVVDELFEWGRYTVRRGVSMRPNRVFLCEDGLECERFLRRNIRL